MANIKVTKLTDISLLRKANSFTTGRDSKMSLAKAYCYGHSPIRTQLFWIEMMDIPLFVASQLVRSHVGVQFFQRSKRTDRGGRDFRKECEDLANGLANAFDMDCGDVTEELCGKVNDLPNHFDRYAPTDLAFIVNAEAIINMSHKRLCEKASKETREIWENVIALIEEVDPDLAKHCVKPCVASCGLCREPKGCGFNKTEMCGKLIEGYKKLFV